MFGIQPETEICVLSWGYKLMHPKVQFPVLLKSHDHVTENGDSQFGTASLRVRISISWRNTLGKQMRKVQWNKQRSRDGACFHPPEQAQRPEPRGQGWLCRGFMGFFCPGTDQLPYWLLSSEFLWKAVPEVFGDLQEIGTQTILFIFQLSSAISVFMDFVPQLYNCVLEIRSPSTEI